MRNVLILGAGGQVPKHVIERLSSNPSIRMSLYLRNAKRLAHLSSARIRVLAGDILETEKLDEAMEGQDVVYVNINGQEDVLAERIVNAMKKAKVKRLIFIAALGMYDEVPGAFGEWNKQMIGPIVARYRKAADLIEASGLEYTILRPTWYTDEEEVNYKLTQKGEPVRGTDISRNSVADLIVKVIENPILHINESLGMEKPGTEGDKHIR